LTGKTLGSLLLFKCLAKPYGHQYTKRQKKFGETLIVPDDQVKVDG
jgi:hypothetical protein